MIHLLRSTIVLTVALLGLASAAPADLKPRWAFPGQQLNKRSFKVERVQYGTAPPSAVKAAVKAYNKWGIPVSENLSKAHQKLKNKKKKAKAGANQPAPSNATGQVGNVTNTPQQGDVEFLAPITVGGQQMVMDFDTGSSDL